MDRVEAAKLTRFVRKHEEHKVKHTDFDFTLKITETGLGTTYTIKCLNCRDEKNLANVSKW